MQSKKLLSALILSSTSLLAVTAYAVCANPTVADCPKDCFTVPAPECCPLKCPETKLDSYPPCSRFAILPGFYVGGQIGYSELYYTRGMLSADSTTDISNTGAGGRVYAGYQLNQYWGGEVGYTRFAKTSVHDYPTAGPGAASGTIQHNAYDVVLKATYPLIDSGFNAYVKAGAAYLQRESSSVLCDYGSVCSNWYGLFTYGAGASYNLTRHVPLEFSWTRIQHNNTVSNSDLFAVGLGYYFG